MACMKCGRETEFEQAFCRACCLEMKRYPVKPGTAVQLPLRKTSAPAKKAAPRRRSLPLEEQVRLLRRRVLTLSVALAVTAALLLAALYPAVGYFLEGYYDRFGRNYTVVIDEDAP